MRPRLLASAQRMLKNDEEAKDIVQDALLKLWQLRDEPIQHPEAMALVILRNLCVDHLRKQTILRHSASPDSLPEEVVALQDARIARLMAIIPQLPVMQQVIVRMHHMQEMETEDIASVLGISEAAVRMSLSRARKRLRDIYNKQKPQL